MARRASSNVSTAAIIGIVIVAVIFAVVFILSNILGGAGYLLGNKKAFDAPLLQIEEALQSANSLRGNEYRVEGKVDSRWVRDTGEGLSLMVEDDGQTKYLFIMIPPEVSHVNIEREQRYAFKIKFGEGGVAIATDVKRL
jgi:hypothetical protein